jgi:hypothetical protein
MLVFFIVGKHPKHCILAYSHDFHEFYSHHNNKGYYQEDDDKWYTLELGKLQWNNAYNGDGEKDVKVMLLLEWSNRLKFLFQAAANVFHMWCLCIWLD